MKGTSSLLWGRELGSIIVDASHTAFGDEVELMNHVERNTVFLKIKSKIWYNLLRYL